MSGPSTLLGCVYQPPVGWPGFPHMLVMHVIFMDILTSRGGWLCGDGGPEMSALDPCLTRSRGPSGEPERTRALPPCSASSACACHVVFSTAVAAYRGGGLLLDPLVLLRV